MRAFLALCSDGSGGRWCGSLLAESRPAAVCKAVPLLKQRFPLGKVLRVVPMFTCELTPELVKFVPQVLTLQDQLQLVRLQTDQLSLLFQESQRMIKWLLRQLDHLQKENRE